MPSIIKAASRFVVLYSRSACFRNFSFIFRHLFLKWDNAQQHPAQEKLIDLVCCGPNKEYLKYGSGPTPDAWDME